MLRLVAALCTTFLATGTTAFGEPWKLVFMGLGDLPGGQFASIPENISADGSTVVGMSVSASGAEAFRWTRGDGIVNLADPLSEVVPREAFGVSADGSVIVGEATAMGTSEAYRWTHADRVLLLGAGSARAASADGGVVVGGSSSPLPGGRPLLPS